MSVFHDLSTHFIRVKDFTVRNDKTSAISSSGRVTGDAATMDGGGVLIRT
ncbi:hypothetical protein A2U01_0016973, partial [Trifolium medium]|nr:hypothetical protein [Trifolium medium]